MIPLGTLASARMEAAGGALTATWLGGTAFQDNSGNTKTFSNVPLGPASDARTVVVAVGNRVSSGGQFVSVTIAGVTATIDAQPSPHASVALARAQVPASAGTSGTVVITKASKEWVFGILGVWHIDTPVAVTDSDWVYVGSGTGTMSRTLTTSPGGVILAAACEYGSATWAWAGADERLNANPYTNISGTAADAATTGADLTISVTPSAANTYGGLVVATYSLA